MVILDDTVLITSFHKPHRVLIYVDFCSRAICQVLAFDSSLLILRRGLARPHRKQCVSKAGE